MRKQTRYLDAVEEGNPIRIATAARRLERGTPAHGINLADFAAEEDEEEDEEDRKERILREDVKGMRLDMFQAKYTSEDNESFNALLDEQNAKQREKYAWKFNSNKRPTKQQFAIEQKKILLLADSTVAPEDIKVVGERTDDQDVWSKEIETWKWTPQNVLMNPHPGLEEQADPSQGQKVIHHTNTRIPTPPRSTGKTPAPSPSMSTVADAIAGRSRADTPKVNGYSFVSTPKPTDLGAPQMTWGTLTSIPSSSEKPSAFRLPDVPAREKLA